MKSFFILLISALFFSANNVQAQANQNTNSFGYVDKKDSIMFVFDQQQPIRVGSFDLALNDKRRDDIKQVNLAGEFNNWDPKNTKYQLVKINAHLYTITLSKNSLCKNGESKQFKFVLNNTYWVEPPANALNKITGKDGNTNLVVKL